MYFIVASSHNCELPSSKKSCFFYYSDNKKMCNCPRNVPDKEASGLSWKSLMVLRSQSIFSQFSFPAKERHLSLSTAMLEDLHFCTSARWMGRGDVGFLLFLVGCIFNSSAENLLQFHNKMGLQWTWILFQSDNSSMVIGTRLS